MADEVVDVKSMSSTKAKTAYRTGVKKKSFLIAAIRTISRKVPRKIVEWTCTRFWDVLSGNVVLV